MPVKVKIARGITRELAFPAVLPGKFCVRQLLQSPASQRVLKPPVRRQLRSCSVEGAVRNLASWRISSRTGSTSAGDVQPCEGPTWRSNVVDDIANDVSSYT